MKAEWKGGIKIVDTSRRIATLRIFLSGDEEQCKEQADEVRNFVEALLAMGIDVTRKRWVRMMTDEEPKKLMARLRKPWARTDERTAADEIERLAERVAELEEEIEISRKKEMKFRREEPKPMVISDD